MGSWVRGFSRSIGITHSLAAELWGLQDGLALAKNLNIKELYIELDVKAVITILTSHDTLFDLSHPYSTLISDCRTLLQCFEVAHITTFTAKEINAQTWQKRDLPLVIVSFCNHNTFPLFFISYFRMLGVFLTQDFVFLSSV